LEAFGRKVTATAGHLIGPLGDEGVSQHYQNALGTIHRELRHPILQRNVFTLANASPRELFRSKLSVNEIQHRALTYLPDELLTHIPEHNSPFSLYQGFQATLPDAFEMGNRRRHGRHSSRSQKLLDEKEDASGPPGAVKLKNQKQSLDHRLEMMSVRKNMCSTEIHEIDNKISNLNSLRKIVLGRLADLEQEEAQLERESLDIENKLDDLQEELEDDAALAGQKTPTQGSEADNEASAPDSPSMQASFMSESIYEKLPAPKTKRHKPTRRKSNFILHEHLQAGSKIRELQAHNDTISALDFDVPFGTMVTAALDDTLRVWDLNAGRCMGLLEGHLSSVRCLQVEENLVATGSMDASVRLWDLSQADYTPQVANRINKSYDHSAPNEGTEDDDEYDDLYPDALHPSKAPATPPAGNMADCALFTLSAHVAEITALHFHNNTLISGSADKTLRQWDLEKGRCIQTLDVLWAAAQASSAINPTSSTSQVSSEAEQTPMWRGKAGRLPDASADFVGALQCFDAALACGTADGLVRLWDLRSGQVHRSLVGHTGPVTCLQFDDVHLVTGSLDRSIRVSGSAVLVSVHCRPLSNTMSLRIWFASILTTLFCLQIWDLRTGSIFDAYAYDNPITSMMFDARRIVAAASEDVVKVYDKTDGRHWDCGDGAGNDDEDERVGHAIVERCRIKDGYMVEGRRDGIVGVWSC